MIPKLVRHNSMRLFIEPGDHGPVVWEGFRLKLVGHPFRVDAVGSKAVKIVES